MSMSINLELEDDMPIDVVFEILNHAVKWGHVDRESGRIHGSIPGASVSLLPPDKIRRELSEEMYGISLRVNACFSKDKSATYETSYRTIFTSIVALLEATSKNAVATEGGIVFLRRIDGRTTLYNDTGLFNADARLQWRPMFRFADDFKERFER